MNVLETNEEKMESLRKSRHKEEPNDSFRIEKYNNQNKISRGWAEPQNGDEGGKKITEFEDVTIKITGSEQQRENRLGEGKKGADPQGAVGL